MSVKVMENLLEIDNNNALCSSDDLIPERQNK